MIKKKDSSENKDQQHPEGKPVYGDPVYGPEEDIFNRAKNAGIDPETGEAISDDNTSDEEWNEKEIDDNDKLGADLDVPGSELDDADELIGEEDEENNYYSLGGDNHENLEEGNPDNA